MSETNSRGPNDLPEGVRSLQITSAGLLFGVINFIAVCVGLRVSGVFPAPMAGTLLTSIFMGLAAAFLVAASIVPSFLDRKLIENLVKQPPEQMSEARLARAYLTRGLISFAILEAATFNLLIAYLLEDQWVSLAMACGMALLMSWSWPTRTGAEIWREGIERRAREASF